MSWDSSPHSTTTCVHTSRDIPVVGHVHGTNPISVVEGVVGNRRRSSLYTLNVDKILLHNKGMTDTQNYQCRSLNTSRLCIPLSVLFSLCTHGVRS